MKLVMPIVANIAPMIKKISSIYQPEKGYREPISKKSTPKANKMSPMRRGTMNPRKIRCAHLVCSST